MLSLGIIHLTCIVSRCLKIYVRRFYHHTIWTSGYTAHLLDGVAGLDLAGLLVLLAVREDDGVRLVGHLERLGQRVAERIVQGISIQTLLVTVSSLDFWKSFPLSNKLSAVTVSADSYSQRGK